MIKIDTNIERIWLLIYLIYYYININIIIYYINIKPEKLQNGKQS